MGPSFHPSIHPSFHPSILPSFLSSVLPSFLPSFRPSFLPSFLPLFLPSFLPSFHPEKGYDKKFPCFCSQCCLIMTYDSKRGSGWKIPFPLQLTKKEDKKLRRQHDTESFQSYPSIFEQDHQSYKKTSTLEKDLNF